MSNRLQFANIAAAVMLVCYGGFTLLSSVLLMLMPNLPYPEVSITAVVYVFGFGLPILGYGILAKHLYHQSFAESFGFRKIPFWTILIAIAIGIFIQPVMSLIAMVAQLFFNDITSTSIGSMTESMPLWFMILTVGVLPAFFEELLCRGILFDGYKETPLWYQLIIPGLFFGFLHLNFQQISYAAVMGIIFALIRYLTGSIWPTMIIHLVVNGSQSALAWLMSNTEALDTLEPALNTALGGEEILPTLWVALPCLVVVIGLILVLCKVHKVGQREKKPVVKGWHTGGWIMYLLLGFLFIMAAVVELFLPYINELM